MLKAVIAILLLNAPANTLSPAIAVAGKSDIHVAGMVSSIPATKLQQFGVNNPKGIAAIVPGLHLPDYGASLTSTIYVRGLGSRMENPVIGLYIDDFPILDKNSYDLDYLDIAGIRFFHGPQGTAALSYRMVPFMAAAKPFKDTYTGTIPHGTPGPAQTFGQVQLPGKLECIGLSHKRLQGRRLQYQNLLRHPPEPHDERSHGRPRRVP